MSYPYSYYGYPSSGCCGRKYPRCYGCSGCNYFTGGCGGCGNCTRCCPTQIIAGGCPTYPDDRIVFGGCPECARGSCGSCVRSYCGRRCGCPKCFGNSIYPY